MRPSQRVPTVQSTVRPARQRGLARRRVLTALGVGAASLVLVAGITVVSLPIVIDPNDHRERIAAEISERTGFALRIDGDLRWSFWPQLAIAVAGVEWPQPDGFESLSDRPLARVETLELGVAWAPLLRRELHVTGVRADALTLDLIRDDTGRGNWQGPAHTDRPPTAPAREPADADGAVPRAPASARRSAAFALDALDVTGARIHWTDLSRGTSIRLDDVTLEARDLRPDTAVPLSARARVATGRTGAAETAAILTLSGELRVASHDGALSLTHLRLDAVPDPHPDRDRAWALRVDGDARLETDTGRFALPQVTAQLTAGDARLALTAEARGDWHGDRVTASGRLDVEASSPQTLVASLRATGAPPSAARPAPAPETQAVVWPATLSWSSRFAFDDAALTLDAITARIDATTLRGDAALATAAEHPRVRFDLAADTLDLDRYLPADRDAATSAHNRAQDSARADVEHAAIGAFLRTAAPAAAATSPTDGGAAWTAALVGPRVDGRLRLATLTARGLRFDDVELPIALAEGQLRARPITARLYGGAARLDLDGDFRAGTPRFGLRGDVDGVDLGALLDAALDAAPVSGRASVNGHLTAHGLGLDAWLPTLDGALAFRVDDGAVRGLDIPGQLRRAQALLRGDPAPEAQGAQTDFATLTGAATIARGIVDNHELLATSSLLRVTGQGRIDLPAETLDYRARVRVVGTLDGLSADLNERLRRIDVPLRVVGPFAGPQVALDLDAALRETLRERAEERLRRELERRLGGAEGDREGGNTDGRRLEDELRRGLQNLFGR